MKDDTLEAFKSRAEAYDRTDPLKAFRSRFHIPCDTEGKEKVYLCNNSLGLPSKDAITMLDKQLKKWSQEGVEGWFSGGDNWYDSLDRMIRPSLGHLLGAKESEVIAMNTLTVNLHLLFISFYRPTSKRYKILIEAPTFPSDLYAVKSHLKLHGYDPDEALIIVAPKNGMHSVGTQEIIDAITQHGSSIALVFFNPVNFLTGNVVDTAKIVAAGHRQGCVVGLDLAHAAGNIPLKLHEWNVDFALGCSYKYLCSGPGGPGIAFVHEKHHSTDLPRLSGWWGNDPKTRFRMQLEENFVPFDGAYSWQVSTPSVIALTPLAASLAIYREAGMEKIREKSVAQTRFLLDMLDHFAKGKCEVVTPRHENARGCQVSLLIEEDAEKMVKVLEAKGVVCDFRPPNIVRVTPSPLYNTMEDIYRFILILI
jgi:kynureninase